MSKRPSSGQSDAELVRLRKDRLKRYREMALGEQVQWVAICDGRTCDICRSLHGALVALDDPRWPTLLKLHAGCRWRFTLPLAAAD